MVDIQGVLNIQIPMMTVSMSTGESVEGALNIDIPMPSVYFSGRQEIQGIFSLSIPMPRLSMTGVINETGSLNITIPMISLSASAIPGAVGILNLSIPMPKFSMSAYPSVEGDLSITIPILLFKMQETVSTYLTMVMNTKNKALTIYNNYNFNSMCSFGGKNFGIDLTGTGIHELDSGKLDNGAPIEWNIKTGYLDMEQKEKKRLIESWLSYKTDGDIKFTVIQPNGEEYEYILTGIDATETGLRLKFGKGIKSKYIAINLSDINGSNLSLDEWKLHFAKLPKVR
jgi:hypothetical protein